MRNYLKKLLEYENHSEKRIKKIILWGIGGYDLNISSNAKYYIELIEKTNIEIVCLVDKFLSVSTYKDYKIFKEDEFKENYEEYKNIYIIPIGRTLQDDKSAFSKIVRNIVNGLCLKNTNILHPVFLADYLPLKYNNKILKIGYGGSGNTVITSVVQNLLNFRIVDFDLGKDEKYFSILALEHKNLIENTVDAGFFFNKFNTTIIGTRWPSMSSISYSNKNDFIILHKIKTKYYLSQNITGTHAFLFDNLIDDFTEKHYKIVNPIRNPLELIVSSSFKLPLMASSVNMIEDKEGKSSIKSRLSTIRLSNIDWFKSTAMYVKAYFETILANDKNIHQIKYESLLDNPNETISALAEYLEIDISDKDIDSIWNRVGLKPLIPNRKAHFFNPTQEKYKRYLGIEHIKILKELGFEDLLYKIGYKDIILKSEKSIPFDKNIIIKDDELKILALSDAFNPKLTPRIFKHHSILTNTFDDIHITTNNPKLIEQFNKIYLDEYANKILNSLNV